MKKSMLQITFPAMLLALVSTLAAKPARCDDADMEAKLHYKQGVALFDHEKYEMSLVEFLKSYELKPNWKVKLNIGICYFNMDKFVEAKKELTTFIKEGGKDIEETKLEMAEDLLGQIAMLTAEITVGVNVEGAAIVLDDEDVGRAPLDGPLTVVAGLHKLSVEAEGYKPAVVKMKAAGGDKKKVEVELKKISEQAGGTDKDVTAEPVPETGKEIEEAPQPAKKKKAALGGLAKGGIGALAAGAALLIAGAGLGGAALSMSNDLEDRCPNGNCGPEDHDDYDSMKSMALGSDILLGLGGAVAVAGVVLVVIGVKKGKTEKKKPEVAYLAPAGLTLGWRY